MFYRAITFATLVTLMSVAPGTAQQSAPNAPSAASKQGSPSGSGIAPATEPSTFADRKLKIPTTAELVGKNPKDAVESVAEINGLVRGGQRTTKAYNALELTATGTMAEKSANGQWKEYKITKLVAGMSFAVPALRFDVRLADADGRAEHQIRVVAGKQAWNEEKPGINGMPMPVTTVDDRLRLIWLTPTGALWGALRAGDSGDKVTVANDAGRATISYSLKDGEPVKIVLDAGMKPQRVELQAQSEEFGNTVMEATYSGYKDFEGYLAPFPTRMTYKAGGRPILDLYVTNHTVNPYVIFPLPANMSK
jgi:hypothetical protein